MRASSDRRVFFALWPGQECRALLAKVQASLPLQGDKARYVPTANLHMTLHFIGNIEQAKVACLQQQARKLAAKPFELVIDTTGYFRKPRVSWLGCSQLPPALTTMQQQLGSLLRDCSFQPETRRYNPHVTMYVSNWQHLRRVPGNRYPGG